MVRFTSAFALFLLLSVAFSAPGDVRRTIPKPRTSGYSYGVFMDATGNRIIAACSFHYYADLFNAATGALDHTFGSTSMGIVTAVSLGDGKIGVVIDNGGSATHGQLFVHDGATFQQLFKLETPVTQLQDDFARAHVLTPQIIVATDMKYSNSRGRAYRYSPTGTYLGAIEGPSTGSTDFGKAVSCNGTVLAITSPRAGSGAVHLFALDGTLLRSMVNPQPSSAGFGTSVLLMDDLVLVGNPYARSVYVFRQSDGTLLTTLSGSDNFGWSLAADANYLYVGQTGTNYRDGRVVYFSRAGLALAGSIKSPSAPTVQTEFGRCVAVCDAGLVVSAPMDEKIYVLEPPGPASAEDWELYD